jgi:cytochrome o ubiquinol oxidase operon protein cyoD
MSEYSTSHGTTRDRAPGIEQGEHGSPDNLRRYLTGFGFAVVLTLGSFWVAGTQQLWGPGVPILLAVLAIAQMGVHLVFFLHISSAPDQTNNFLALTFGVFVVGLVVFGSMIIMANLNANMMPMQQLMEMQR